MHCNAYKYLPYLHSFKKQNVCKESFMQSFSNMSLKMRLTLGFLILNLSILIISGIAILNTYKSIQAAEDIDSILEESFIQVVNTQNSIEESNELLLNYLREQCAQETIAKENGTFVPKSNARSEVVTKIRLTLDELQKISSAMSDDRIGKLKATETYTSEIRKAKDAIEQMQRLFNDEVVTLTRKGEYTEALNNYIGKVLPKVNDCLDSCKKLINEQVDLTLAISIENLDMKPMIICIVIAVLALSGALLISRSLLSFIDKHIEKIIEFTRRMAHGDFSFHVESSINGHLGKLYNEIGKLKENLGNSIKKVVDSYHKLGRGIDSVTENIDAVNQNVTQAGNLTVSVSAASDEMVSTTAEIAKNCEDAAGSAKHSRSITSEGISQAEQIINQIREQAAKTAQDASVIETLLEQSNKIGSIVQTIEDIAAQTNLLALNAAIEAARAGEYGRGFAVVADEVRALASRSSDSTHEITKMVSQIQNDANIANTSMVNSVNLMNELADKANNVNAILRDMINNVDGVSDQINQIATAATQKTTVTSEISNNMHVLSNISQDCTQKSNDSNEELIKLLEYSKEVLAMLDNFRFRS